MSFLTASRAGLARLLDCDDLGFLEDVHASSESLKRLLDLLDLLDLLGLLECDDLGFLEDVLASSESLKRLVLLLGHDGQREHLPQFSSDPLLGGRGAKRARGLVVSVTVAERADHIVLLCEARVDRFVVSLLVV